MAIALALASAVMYGVSDYVGGRASRRFPATAVAFGSEVVLFVVCIVAVPLVESDAPPGEAIWWGLAAGVTGSLGIVGLYVALARGNMTVVAPVTGVVAAVVPVAVGVLTGERPSAIAVVGIVVAVIAVALIGGLASVFRADSVHPLVGRQTVLIAIGVGLAFGLLFAALAQTDDDSGQWPLLFARFTSLPVLAAAFAIQVAGTSRRPVGSPLFLPALVIGLLIAGSNATYLISTREGLLSVVAVVVAMYPASTILLASVIDGERATRWQLAGMALAAAALVMITAGS
jgi:drug/metabolite transporter (DMT)-like permease